jgi:hypothetical protein
MQPHRLTGGAGVAPTDDGRRIRNPYSAALLLPVDGEMGSAAAAHLAG